MRCDKCGADKMPSDFLFNNTLCYKCIYTEKIKTKKNRPPQLKPNCKMCGNEVPEGRFCYCSERCSRVGGQIMKDNYIKNNFSVNVDPMDWHKRNLL